MLDNMLFMFKKLLPGHQRLQPGRCFQRSSVVQSVALPTAWVAEEKKHHECSHFQECCTACQAHTLTGFEDYQLHDLDFPTEALDKSTCITHTAPQVEIVDIRIETITPEMRRRNLLQGGNTRVVVITRVVYPPSVDTNKIQTVSEASWVCTADEPTTSVATAAWSNVLPFLSFMLKCHNLDSIHHP